jgi:transposase
MPSLIKKTSKYSTYYVIAESKRVDGKPRIVKQWYLGTIEKLIAMAEDGAREEVRQIDCVDEGGVAALCKVADDIGVRDIVNSICSKRKQGMSVGDYILIAALNRALAAASKSKVKEWVDSTALHLYLPLDAKKLESQNFWDHFEKIDAEKAEKIGDAVARRVAEVEKIDLDCLVYDTTNYFNYWDVTTPSDLAKMAKSKAGKDNLRHIGLATAVDRKWGIPLFNRLYPANEHDSKVFVRLIDAIFQQINQTTSDKKGVTFVFDKGNNSDELIQKIDESRHHFIGTRSPYHHKDLCRTSLDKFADVTINEGETVLAFETRLELYGKPRRVILTHNEPTYRRQLHRLERHVEQAKSELSFFKRKAKEADGRSTIESIERQADEILQHHHVQGLLKIDVEETDKGFKISARKDIPAVEDAKTRLGKQVIFTNRETLTAAEVIAAYRDRAVVEDVFRITKSDRWVKMDPAFHWTDSKIRVHALTCMLALLIVRVAHKRAREKGFAHGAERMLELLSGIRSAIMFYPKSSKPRRMLCSISEEQRDLLTKLGCQIKDSR